MKKLFLILFIMLIVVFCFSACAIELGVSKQEISLNSKTGERVCSEVLVYSEDYSGNYIVKDLWLDEENYDKKKKLGHYNVESDELKIEIDYDKIFSASEINEEKVCFIAFKPGNYYGVLLFRPVEGNVGVGTWMYLNVSGESLYSQKSLVLQGAPSFNRDYNLLLFCLFEIFLLCEILIFLIMVNAGVNREYVD